MLSFTESLAYALSVSTLLKLTLYFTLAGEGVIYKAEPPLKCAVLCFSLLLKTIREHAQRNIGVHFRILKKKCG